MERVISVVVRWPVLRVGLRAAHDTPDEISSSHLGNSVTLPPSVTDGIFGNASITTCYINWRSLNCMSDQE